MIFRVMGEVVKMLSVLGAAERFPLYTSLDEIKVGDFFFMQQLKVVSSRINCCNIYSLIFIRRQAQVCRKKI